MSVLTHRTGTAADAEETVRLAHAMWEAVGHIAEVDASFRPRRSTHAGRFTDGPTLLIVSAIGMNHG